MARRRRTKVQRVINLIKKVIAFLFSNVGLFAIVVGYAFLGAITFRSIERPHEIETQKAVFDDRHRAVRVIWNSTYQLNVLDELRWKETARQQVLLFKTNLLKNVKRGYDGKEYEQNAQWTVTGAFLYSLTVITTIGKSEVHEVPEHFLS